MDSSLEGTGFELVWGFSCQGQARQITIPSITILAGNVMFGINPN
jgi:hypothetical protein